MNQLTVDIWSDIACPWCYVGKRRFEAALGRFEHRASVAVRWRSFELNPAAPRVEVLEDGYAARLARKYGTSTARGEEMVRSMTATAAGEGLEFRFDRIRPGNTFDAHRLLHFAAERGVADAAAERLMLAYMTEGAAIGERETLADLGADLGLDRDEVRTLLESKRFEREVRADEDQARARGVGGVPHVSIGGRPGLSGAQPPEALLHMLRAAWAEHAPDQVAGGGADRG